MTGAWLGIETTGPRGGAALVGGGGEVLAESVLELRAACSVTLLPAIRSMMEEAGIEGGGLGGVAVSTGPGSYTGVRIGIATAAGLASGWGVGVRGVPTLRVLAWQAGSPGPVLAAVRARQGEVFAAAFRSSDPFSELLFGPGVYLAGAVGRILSGLGSPALVGSGAPEILPGRAPASPDQPAPASVAALGMALALRDGFEGTPAPLYLRSFREEAVSPVS